MDLALLVLRVVVGLLFVGHGTQKLFGWFGGHGLAGTSKFFDSLGIGSGRRNALLAGATEAGGGLLLALGLFTPFAAAGLIAVMATATWTVHRAKGLWSSDGGYEYNLVLASIAFALAGAGPDAWSLDYALSLDLAGTGWALAALAAGIGGSALTIVGGRALAHRNDRRHPATA